MGRVVLQSLDRFFYFGMALLLAAIVVYGFSHTVGDSLIHPDVPPPTIFYVHAIVFASWVVLFAVQSGLVRDARVGLHRRLGTFGLALGGTVPILGVATAVTSQQSTSNHAFFAVSLNDMLLFATAFWLGVYWRRRPAFHRRLMLVATCGLMGAALARFPFVPGLPWAYGGVDALILVGVLRDLLLERRVHAVYCWALPCVVAGQALALYLFQGAPQVWLDMLHIVFN
jgi:hypothetical protein